MSNARTRPLFPLLNKYINVVRKVHYDYVYSRDRARFPYLPYWKLLVPGKPVSPVPVDPLRDPVSTIVEASDFAVNSVNLSSDLLMVGYPQPLPGANEVEEHTTEVTVFGEAEWDKMRFKAFSIPGYITVEHSAELTKFGMAIKTDGKLKFSRFILELTGLEPGAGDIFQWDNKLRIITEAYREYGYIGTSDYWTWLDLSYVDFTGDSSNLTLPDLEEQDVVVPEDYR